MSPLQHDTTEHAQQPADESSSSTPRKLRYTPTVLLPLIIAALCAVPFAAGLGVWGLLIAIPFIVVGFWLRRIGLDINADDVNVRSALSTVTIPRSDLVGFTADKKHVSLVRTNGSTVRIPTVRPRDLPMLRESLFPRIEPA